MTADQLWPDAAREAVAAAFAVVPYSTPIGSLLPGLADAVLAALSAYAVPRAAITAVLDEHWGDHTGYCVIHADVLRALTRQENQE